MKNLGDYLPNLPKRIAEWAEEEHGKHGNSSWKNEFYLYAMSFWHGTLLPRAQIRKARQKNKPDAIFTKYNTTYCYLTMLAVEHIPLFLASQNSNNNTDDLLFWANLGIGVTLD